MESRGVLQDIILDVWELELPQVPVEGWIIDPYEHGFLDSPDSAVCFPTHYGETVHIETVSRRLSMFVYGERSPKVIDL